MLNYNNLNFGQPEAIDLVPYHSTRAKIVRQADGAMFSAWVSPSHSGQLQLAMSQQEPLTPGDSFQITLTNTRASIVLDSTFVGFFQGRATFEVKQYSEPQQPVEQMRRKESGLSATMVGGGIEAMVEVADFSPRGLGILSPIKISVGTTMKFTVATRLGAVTMDARAVWSKVESEHQNFRIGFEISQIAPTDEQAWIRFVEATHSA